MVTHPQRISFGLVALALLAVGGLHRSMLLLTVLFVSFALQTLMTFPAIAERTITAIDGFSLRARAHGLRLSLLGEKLMGIPGMILAPVVLHYIKVEASQHRAPPPSSA